MKTKNQNINLNIIAYTNHNISPNTSTWLVLLFWLIIVGLSAEENITSAEKSEDKLIEAELIGSEVNTDTSILAAANSDGLKQNAVTAQQFKPAALPVSKFMLDIPKNHQRTLCEVGGVVAGVWAYDNYLMQEEWAVIGTNSVKKNFEHGFEWDSGKFDMNQFAHPYHGNIYFTAARSNGLNFYQSIPYTVGGSLTWELFMENHYPSINDMIMTTMGGVAMGEVLFRLSNYFIDESSTGLERFARETATTILSPMNGLNRWLDGRMSSNSGYSFSDSPITFKLSLGGNGEWRKQYNEKMEAHSHFGIMIEYNDLIQGKKQRNPYDYFKVHVAMSIAKENRVAMINEIGMIRGIEVEKKNTTFIYGMFQHYDYIDNNVIMLSSVSLGPGIEFYTKFRQSKYMKVNFHLQGIALGGTSSDYNPEKMDYNMGSGFACFSNFELGKEDSYNLGFYGKNYWMKNIKGERGVEKIWIGCAYAGIPIYKSLHYYAEFMYYNRNGEYQNLPDTSEYTDILRTFVSLEI